MAEAEDRKEVVQGLRGSLAAGRRPTIEMVAQHAGVSRQTVSNACNAPNRLRPETLRRVSAVIEELGYRPSQAARSLRTDATHIIGCRLLPSNYGGTGGVLDGWFHALCDAARSSSYDILTFAALTDDDEIAIYADLLQRRAVDGVVLTNTHHLDARPAAITEMGARCVAFGRPWGVRRPGHSWVDVDNASGTSEAVRHLAALGHTRIAFLGVDEDKGVGDDRYRGWRKTMEKLGLPTKGLVGRAVDGIASGRLLAETLLGTQRPPSGFVCVTDAMAVGAMHAIEDRGGRPGRDVSVVGFDDSPIASVVRPRLSSLRQPIETVAARLIELLLSELNEAPHHPARVLLKPHLIVRESSDMKSSLGKPAERLSGKGRPRAKGAQAEDKVSVKPENNTI
jgi:DNA-binding LacI/PurR family transcriptional regulator